MAYRFVSLSGLIFLLGVMLSGIASGAEITIQNGAGLGSSNGCNARADTSIIRLQVQGVHKLLPLLDDVRAGGNDPSHPAKGSSIADGANSMTFNTSATTYTVVIEMGSWREGGSGAGGQFTQARYTHDNVTDGCNQPRFRYLDFTVTGQGPGLLTLRVQPSGNQYQVVVQGGTATLSTAAVGQKTTTDFTRKKSLPALAPQRFSVAENSAAAIVVGTLVATDPPPLTYSVTGGTGQGVFAVNPTTGQITVVNSSRLDFETTPTFTLQVQVTDNETPPLSASAPITIDLTNVNEKPVLAPQRFSVAENSAAATVVGTLAATDPDRGQLLTYRVTGGTGQGVFAVNLTTGQITVLNSSRLDFETTKSFTLQVQVTDNGTPPLSASAPITIDLTDVNEDQLPPATPQDVRVQ